MLPLEYRLDRYHEHEFPKGNRFVQFRMGAKGVAFGRKTYSPKLLTSAFITNCPYHGHLLRYALSAKLTSSPRVIRHPDVKQVRRKVNGDTPPRRVTRTAVP